MFQTLKKHKTALMIGGGVLAALLLYQRAKSSTSATAQALKSAAESNAQLHTQTMGAMGSLKC